MLHVALLDVLWAFVYISVGVAIGAAFILGCSAFVPRALERITPHLDEDKEIARGNRAVAEYFGRVVSATILGISIIVAAAVLGGTLSAFHG